MIILPETAYGTVRNAFREDRQTNKTTASIVRLFKEPRRLSTSSVVDGAGFEPARTATIIHFRL